jgi:hypothetical protein
MSTYRNFDDTMPTEPARLATHAYSSPVRRGDRIANITLSVLLGAAIGAGLAWWLWEWTAQCLELFTCGLALVRPHTPSVASANQERLALAVVDAHKVGHDTGYVEGFRDGVRWSRLAHGALGMVLGAGLVAAALQLGHLVGGAG